MKQPEKTQAQSLNPYEAGSQKVIPAVLVYLRHQDQILMIHRTSSLWNGLGGKCELNESPLEAARREIYEEAEVDLPEEVFKPLGVIQFPNFKPQKNEDWIVFVFICELTAPQAQLVHLRTIPEGELHWIAESKVPTLKMWPGDSTFLPLVLASRPFMGTIWYHDQTVVRHLITPLSSQ